MAGDGWRWLAMAGDGWRGARSERVLVVEDEPALLELVSTIFQKYGYTIFQASNGVEALKIWKRRRDEIDLLVTDMVMPEGISGLELAEGLRSDRPELKVLCTSGYSADVAGDDLELNEGVNFIAKPYHPSALARAIRRCLGDEADCPSSTGGIPLYVRRPARYEFARRFP